MEGFVASLVREWKTRAFSVATFVSHFLLVGNVQSLTCETELS
jgi:hypothetical protein